MSQHEIQTWQKSAVPQPTGGQPSPSTDSIKGIHLSPCGNSSSTRGCLFRCCMDRSFPDLKSIRFGDTAESHSSIPAINSRFGTSATVHRRLFHPVYDSMESLTRMTTTTDASTTGEAVENDGPSSSDIHQEPIHRSTTSTESRRAKIEETMLFFFSAVGCTIGWTAVLSNLVFYTDTLGVNSYLYLNLFIYGPLFPITIAQTLWDADFDRQFTSLRSFRVRGIVGFSVTLVSVLLLAPASAHPSLTQVSLLSLCLGTASGILHGTLKQMASFVYPGCGRLAAAVTAGLQASAVGVLLVSLTTSSKSSSPGNVGSTTWLYYFYGSISVLVGLCWWSFQRLMTHSQDVYRSMLRRDSSIQLSAFAGQGNDEEENNDNEPECRQTDLLLTDASLSPGGSTEDDDDDHLLGEPLLLGTNSQATRMPTMKQLFWQSWPLCVAIFLTVASSMAVASWFNRVPSAHARMADILPQILFYTRLFADLLSRPVTLWLPQLDEDDSQQPRTTVWYLMALVFLRLLFVPYFFLYTSASLPRSDMVMTLGVFGFAFSSGFITTLVYQLAPRYCTTVEGQPIDDIVLKQTNLLNVCFSASVLLGLMGSLSLSEIGMSHNGSSSDML